MWCEALHGRLRYAAMTLSKRSAAASLVFTRPAARTIGSSGGNWVRSAKDEIKKSLKDGGGSEGGKPERNVGDALRQAYDEAVGEAVPDDLLDLLKKLD
jgi:hypothetical protein